MKKLVAIAILLSAISASAQRPYSATYDAGRQVKLQGVVTRIEWVNPSAFVYVDVRDASGIVTNWAIDIGNPLELERDGWKRNAAHVGDAVTIEGSPARGTARQAFAKSVVLARTAKRVFGPATTRRAVAAATPAPRWPDG